MQVLKVAYWKLVLVLDDNFFSYASLIWHTQRSCLSNTIDEKLIKIYHFEVLTLSKLNSKIWIPHPTPSKNPYSLARSFLAAAEWSC